MRLYVCTIILASLFSLGCQGPKRDQYPDGNVQVRLPIYDAEKKNYFLQIVDLVSVSNMVEFKGWAAEFFLQASIAKGKNKRIQTPQIVGMNPKIKTIRNQNGIYIATDEISLQLLTVYYHLENLAIMDELVGAKDVNTWPRKVALQVNYVDPKAGKIQNNALYAGDLDALLLVPYTQTALPISVNAGIIAHEHFHSLFYKLVLEKNEAEKLPFPQSKKALHDEDELIYRAFGNELNDVEPASAQIKVSKDKDDNFQYYLLRGINEGLADFWGWLYTQDNSFVGRSLPVFKNYRDLSFQQNIMSNSCFELLLESGNELAVSYDYGVTLARYLRATFLEYQKTEEVSFQDTKVIFGKAVIEALKELGQEKRQKIETTTVAELILKNFPSRYRDSLQNEKVRCRK
jgi:hypothetical protein